MKMTMDQVPEQHPLQDWIPDYLNDHLSAEDRAQFETQLNGDPSLQAMVALERKIQAAVLAEQPQTEVQPDFAAFEQRLQRRRSWLPRWGAVPRWSAVGIPAAACALAMVVWVNNPADQLEPTADYETKTTPSTYDRTVLRIVAHDSGTIDQIVAAHQLRVHTRYDELNTADVSVADQQDMDALAALLADDPRISFTQLIVPEYE